MKTRHLNLLLFLFLVLVPHLGFARGPMALEAGWELNEIEISPSGFMKRTSGDPYIVFPEMKEVQYNIKGVEVEITFSPMIAKPFMMELFWRPEHDAFSEQRKVFFVLLPSEEEDSIKFFVPLTGKDGYKQFRLDLPGDLPVAFQVKGFQAVSDQQVGPDVDVQRVEAFYHIGATEVRTPEIFIPYLVHTLQHGLGRLLKDPGFLVVWLLLIFAALLATRKVTRDLKEEKQKVTMDGSDPGE